METKVIVIDSQAFDELEKRQMERFEKAMQKAYEKALRQVEPNSKWVNTEEALKITGFKSRNHLYNLRQKDLLLYKKVNGQIRYNYFSLIDYINKDSE